MKLAASVYEPLFRFTRVRVPRLFLLPAAESPRVAVLARLARDRWRLGLFDADTSSWRDGDVLPAAIYPRSCDISPDGEWLVYLAFAEGRRLAAWTGLTRVPSFDDVARWPATYTFGGGVFLDREKLAIETNRVEAYAQYGEHPFSLSQRLAFAGYWRRNDDCELKMRRHGFVPSGVPARWVSEPPGLPPLVAAETPWEDYTDPRWAYWLWGYPELLRHGVTSACWHRGKLMVGRRGCLEVYEPGDLDSGEPSVRHKLEELESHL